MKEKRCPICGKSKSLDQFDTYFSKERQKYRVQNYCKECQHKEAKRRSAAYYQKNKDGRKQYAKDYRKDPDNKEKLQTLSRAFKIKYREELKDCYVRDRLSQDDGIPPDFSRDHPEVVEVKRLKIKIQRKIKELKYVKKINYQT